MCIRDRTMAVVDQLWTDKYLEIKHLAAILIGLIPASLEDEILARMSRWGKSTPERSILDILFRDGTRQLRKSASTKWIHTIDSWVQSNSPRDLTSSIRALISLVRDPEFENLPVVYNMFSNLTSSFLSFPERDFQDLLLALFEREPKETLFFLKQLLTIGIPEQLIYSIRRLIPDLPKDVQARVRMMIPRSS
jgi:hypothetical protein